MFLNCAEASEAEKKNIPNVRKRISLYLL